MNSDNQSLLYTTKHKIIKTDYRETHQNYENSIKINVKTTYTEEGEDEERISYQVITVGLERGFLQNCCCSKKLPFSCLFNKNTCRTNQRGDLLVNDKKLERHDQRILEAEYDSNQSSNQDNNKFF